MKRLYVLGYYYRRGGFKDIMIAYTLRQYLMMRLFKFLAKWSWTWCHALGRFYPTLRRFMQTCYFHAHCSTIGYGCDSGIERWYPKPLVPGHWTMEDLARAAFEKGLNVNFEFVRSN